MNLLLFILILIISLIVVRIGAIAFELTGLEWSLARFQALSCFTGTGFTTREAELVTTSPQRRRIASTLMVLGHAGLVALIATFVNSLRMAESPRFSIPFFHWVLPPRLVPLANLLTIAIAAYLVYAFFTHTRFARKLTDILRAHIRKKEIIKPVSFDELLVSTGGYGVSSIEIGGESPILGKTIVESGLRGSDITVLVIEREGVAVANPPADAGILSGDKLICFGKLGNIRKTLGRIA